MPGLESGHPRPYGFSNVSPDGPSQLSAEPAEPRPPALFAGLAIVTVVETGVVHLLLHAAHPALAWVSTAAGASTFAWLLFRAARRGRPRACAPALPSAGPPPAP